MTKEVHVFDNGVNVYDYQLTPAQRKRYRERNVHEADEEEIFVEIASAIPADGCFINIGSAIGYYVILAKKLAPGLTIHAVEPLGSHRRHFAENVVLNELSLDDFRLHREGVSCSEGYGVFFDRGYGSRILHDQGEEVSLKSRIKATARVLLALLRMRDYGIVRTITLDKIMNRVGRPADLLQMDVQGLEAEVLGGGTHSLQAGLVKTFLVGTHGREVHQKCIDVLMGTGYSVEFEEAEAKNQPDGIIVASKGVRRLAVQDRRT